MTKPERDDPRYNELPLKDHDRTKMNFPGVVGHGTPFFHHDDSGMIYKGNVDDTKQQIRLEETTEHDSASETLGETIESIGERIGWESLSEFAQEHLPDEENN